MIYLLLDRIDGSGTELAQVAVSFGGPPTPSKNCFNRGI